jgi:hypothetical protein
VRPNCIETTAGNGASTIHAQGIFLGVDPRKGCLDKLELEVVQVVDSERGKLVREHRRHVFQGGAPRSRQSFELGPQARR